MVYVIKFLYSTFLVPPGIFIISLALLFCYLYKKQAFIAKIGFAFTLLFYLSTTSLVGDLLIGSLERKYDPPPIIQGDVIIMLGGGATLDTPNLHGLGHLSGFAANRLLTSAQLYHELHIPIVLSGGKVFETTGTEAEIGKIILMGLGVPSDQIISENQSINTTENAKNTKQIMNQYGFTQPILVTSAFHMERSVLQFKKVDVAVVPYPTDYQVNRSWKFEMYHLWPSAGALLNISMALKEYTGILASKWY